ncbi:peptidoglycan-binding domain-containing protein [Sphaerotilus natans]|uniref:peptidoglycan-binding domain-containing protein n=1 Tax=Sphaerotilus natans TaxID=34103 RepID=UPI0035BED0F3
MTPWPTDDAGLSRAERRELQQLLAARGHDIGAIDGLLGERSRAAIRAERGRLFGERAPDGRAGQKLLRTLRAEALLAAPESPPAEAPISR